jgi:hypothetical protein
MHICKVHECVQLLCARELIGLMKYDDLNEQKAIESQRSSAGIQTGHVTH